MHAFPKWFDLVFSPVGLTLAAALALLVVGLLGYLLYRGLKSLFSRKP